MNNGRNDVIPAAPTHDHRTMRTPHLRGGFLVLGLLVFACGEAAAEFHVWHDAAGHKHVSSVPARGYRAERRLKPQYDPNSIVYQHRRMRERLQLLDAELEHQAATAQGEAIADQPAPSPPVRGAPREGVMNLDELIALEKRGGRWLGDETTQGGATRAK